MINTALTYAELFDNAKSALPGDTVVAAKRQEALDYFTAHGFPKSSREEWKYTRLGAFLTAPMEVGERTTLTLDALKPYLIEGLEGYRMVFVNGWRDTALSNTGSGEVKGIASVPDMLSTVNAQDEMEALNIAFMTDGILLHVPENTSLDKPIYAVFVHTKGAVYPRNKIILEKGSNATLIEHYITLGKTQGMTNVATEVVLKENATLTHYKHQQEAMNALHIATSRVTLNAHSKYSSYAFTTGGMLARDAIQVMMEGSGSSSKLCGIYLGKDRQHLDHYIPVHHNAPGCKSEQRYKGVLDENAKGIFYGKVLVPPDAQKTDAHQSNHNLLLSETAMVYSRPELEIHANDVKCSHGSATGAVNKDAMFYLRSRGINEADARSLLVEGFVRELLEDIPHPSIKQHWQGALQQWLGIKP